MIANPFEALCDRAARMNWCWRFDCTTCGNLKIRKALAKIGQTTPDGQAGWNGVQLPPPVGVFEDPDPQNENTWAELVYRTVAAANPVRIVLRSQDRACALGCLGHALRWLEDREQGRGLISRRWRAALRRYEQKHGLPIHGELVGEEPNLPRLTWRDVSQFGMDLPPEKSVDECEYLARRTIFGDIVSYEASDEMLLLGFDMVQIANISIFEGHLAIEPFLDDGGMEPGVAAIVNRGTAVWVGGTRSGQLKAATSPVLRANCWRHEPENALTPSFPEWLARLNWDLLSDGGDSQIEVWGRRTEVVSTAVGDLSLEESIRTETRLLRRQLGSQWLPLPVLHRHAVGMW